MKLKGISWLFKKKKIKTIKKCLDCSNPAKRNSSKYCLECSIKHMTASNSKQSLKRYHRNKNK